MHLYYIKFIYLMLKEKNIDTPLKYYFEDIGLRNARLKFRQQEENHIKKNIVIKDYIIPWYDEKGILYVWIKQFLLDETIIGY